MFLIYKILFRVFILLAWAYTKAWNPVTHFVCSFKLMNDITDVLRFR